MASICIPNSVSSYLKFCHKSIEILDSISKIENIENQNSGFKNHETKLYKLNKSGDQNYN